MFTRDNASLSKNVVFCSCGRTGNLKQKGIVWDRKDSFSYTQLDTIIIVEPEERLSNGCGGVQYNTIECEWRYRTGTFIIYTFPQSHKPRQSIDIHKRKVIARRKDEHYCQPV